MRDSTIRATSHGWRRKRINRRSFDLRPFAGTEHKLAVYPETWIETSDLIADLKIAARGPIPEIVLDHLRNRLEGSAKKRQGRGRQNYSHRMRNLLIASSFERREACLAAREAKPHCPGFQEPKSPVVLKSWSGSGNAVLDLRQLIRHERTPFPLLSCHRLFEPELNRQQKSKGFARHIAWRFRKGTCAGDDIDSFRVKGRRARTFGDVR